MRGRDVDGLMERFGTAEIGGVTLAGETCIERMVTNSSFLALESSSALRMMGSDRLKDIISSHPLSLPLPFDERVVRPRALW
jgi:hypothetical protein